MQLSPHFSLAEMTVTTHRDIDNGLDPSDPRDRNVIENLKLLCQGLEAIRTFFAAPVVVSSGFRCPALNQAVGSKPTSAHILGYAADFGVIGWTPLGLAQEIDKATRAGELPQFDQLIYEHPGSSRWVHLSFAPRLRMETLTVDHMGTHIGIVPD